MSGMAAAANPVLLALPDELVGERVRVRPYRPGDGAAFFEAVEESREHLRPWVGWADKHATPDDAEAYARRMQARWLAREDLTVALFDRATGRFVGGAGLHDIEWDVPAMEVGYWVRASAQGGGYVTEAVRLLCRLAFGTLGTERLTLTCDAKNERSAAVARRAGFVHEGTLRRHCRGAGGDLRDTLVFGMTREDFATTLGGGAS